MQYSAPYRRWLVCYGPPRISFRPSSSRSSSSGETRPILLPILSTDSVRTWLIFTHDCLGSLTEVSSSVRGNPAACGWPVIAIAITVPDRALKTSSLTTTTGRRPLVHGRGLGSSLPKQRHLSVFGPLLQLVCEPLLGNGLFQGGIEFRAFTGKSGIHGLATHPLTPRSTKSKSRMGQVRSNPNCRAECSAQAMKPSLGSK